MRLGKLKVILEIIPFVQSLLNCSKEPLDLPNAPTGYLPYPQGERGLGAPCSPTPSTGADRLWSVLYIKVSYTISFGRRIPYFSFKKSWGTSGLEKGVVPRSQAAVLGPRSSSSSAPQFSYHPLLWRNESNQIPRGCAVRVQKATSYLGFSTTPSLPCTGGDVALTMGGSSGDGGQGPISRFLKGPGLQEKI